jgi:predicted enzyme related to lactoylglutathione lyase
MSESIPDQSTTAAEPRLTGVTFVAAYVDDFDRALDFYTNVLGLKKQYDMGDRASFLRLSDDVGLYLEGGKRSQPADDPSTRRASFGLTAASVDECWSRVTGAGATTVQSAPVEMGEGWLWFQCHDPAGNLIEIVGER